MHRLLAALLGGALALAMPAPAVAQLQDSTALTPVTAAVMRYFPPTYSTDAEGKPQGFGVDVMNAVAQRAHLRVKYVVFDSWLQLQAALVNGEVQVVPSMGITDQRMQLMDFTRPIETYSVALFVRANTPSITGLHDLAGRPVAVVRNNVGVDVLRSYWGPIPRVYDEISEALVQLLSGEVDGLVFPAPIVWKVARSIGVENRIETTGPALLDLKRAMAVRKGNKALLQRLEAAANDLVESPEYQYLYVRWYGVPPSFWSDSKVWWTIAAAFGAVVLVMGGWRYQGVLRLNRKLHQEYQERVRAEEQLRQAQKMEAVGRLAGGIAHDFNNMLQIIHGYAELAQSKLDRGHRSRDDLGRVLQAANSAAALTKQLLAFSRREPLELRMIDLNELIARETVMLSRLMGSNVALDTLLDDTRPLVRADSVMLEQILMNLAVNARDASTDGGRIVIETRTVEADADFCRLNSWARPGSYAVMSVSDTGTGMSADVQRRIFDPFFTTKRSGKGTGLGLSMVYGMVQQHQGGIVLSSIEGRGTTFQVYLPRAIGMELDEAPPTESGMPRGDETVLIAEDEPDVLRLLTHLLQGHGYRVLTAVDGEAAVDCFRRNRGGIRLVILDVVMPKLGGRGAYERIRTMDETIPILFSTGHTADDIDADFISQSRFRVIRKPYAPDELLRAVREALDEQEPAALAC